MVKNGNFVQRGENRVNGSVGFIWEYNDGTYKIYADMCVVRYGPSRTPFCGSNSLNDRRDFALTAKSLLVHKVFGATFFKKVAKNRSQS